jgi:hypothetical protein
MPAQPKPKMLVPGPAAAPADERSRQRNPLLPEPPQLSPERARLRRLAESLGEVLTPLAECPGAVGAYRTATAPGPMLALLDYVDELHRQLDEARSFYQDNVQALLVAWKDDCHAQGPSASPTPFFELKCRELIGRSLDETAEPVELPQPWPAATPHPAFAAA